MNLVNVAGAAQHLGISERHVRELVYRREIPYIKVGRLVRFDEQQLAQWLASRQVHVGQDLPVRRPDPEMAPTPQVVSAVGKFMARYGEAETLRLLNGGPRRTSLPASIRDEVVRRDGRQCRYCGKHLGPRTPLHVDHITPVVAGGSNEPSNLAVACERCNMRKNNAGGWECRRCGRLTWGEQDGNHVACLKAARLEAWEDAEVERAARAHRQVGGQR